MPTVVFTFPPARAETLRAALATHDMRFGDEPHAFFRARRPGVVVTAYKSGKLTVAGEQAEEFAFVIERAHAALGLARSEAKSSERAPFARRVGSDESGKGDLFGPLVVAAVRIDEPAVEQALVTLGVRDSKALADAKVRELATKVRDACAHEVVTIGPKRYNELYAEMGNLNLLLAWAHARAIDAELSRGGAVEEVVVDEFDRRAVERALSGRLHGARLIQETRAESRYLAVAAASILARAAFVDALAALSQKWGTPLPKGAGAPVEAARSAFVKKHGEAALAEVAKLHFRSARSSP